MSAKDCCVQRVGCLTGQTLPALVLRAPLARLAPWRLRSSRDCCVTNQLLVSASVTRRRMPVYVQCALDVWTVVDIYGMWIVGPRLYWGYCGFSGVSILSAVIVLYV